MPTARPVLADEPRGPGRRRAATCWRRRRRAHGQGLQGRQQEADGRERRVARACAAARPSVWSASRAAARRRSPSASPASSPADAGTVASRAEPLRPRGTPLARGAARHPDGLPEPRLDPQPGLEHARHPHARRAQAGRRRRGARKVDKLVGRVRVEPRFLAQSPTELSGGQKQRIAIARAFAGDPTLVVCDEPASALDVSVQASILNLLVELQTSEQVSYVFISHDLAVVRYISDRIGVMYLAELIEVGSADEVFNAAAPPLHRGAAVVDPQARVRQPAQRIELRGSMPSLSEPPTRLPLSHALPPVPGRHLRAAGAAACSEASERPHLQVPHPARRAARRPAGRAAAVGLDSRSESYAWWSGQAWGGRGRLPLSTTARRRSRVQRSRRPAGSTRSGRRGCRGRGLRAGSGRSGPKGDGVGDGR